MLQVDQKLREALKADVTRFYVGDEMAAIQYKQAVGKFVHMRQVMFDINAGAARTL